MNNLPIPLRCAARPQSSGLVVPAVSVVHNGHVAFGILDARRVRRALLSRLCQICDQPLSDRVYLIVRPADMRTGYTAEPAIHPECFGYAKGKCPVLNGTARRYRDHSALDSHPAFRPCDGPTCPYPGKIRPGADQAARLGQLVDRYEAWMISLESYRLVPREDDPGTPLGIALDAPVLRKRLVREAALPEKAEAVLAELRSLLGLEP